MESAVAAGPYRGRSSPFSASGGAGRVALIVAAVMTAFEAVKTWVHPSMSLWTSHTITIAFSTLVGALAAFWALRRHSSVERVLMRESEDRRAAEAARTALVEQTQALSMAADELRQQIRVREAVERELRDEREQRQAVIDALPDPYMIVGHDGVVREIHENGASFAAWRPSPAWVGQPWSEVVPPEVAQALSSAVARSLERAESHVQETEVTGQPGDLHPVMSPRRLELRVVRVTNGEVLVLFRDRTERLALEEQLLHAQKMEGIGRLAGGVAHDFNNLLTAIVAHAEFAADGLPSDGPARDDLEAIQGAASLGAGLTRQLLAFARRDVARVRPTDLGEVLRGLEHLLRRTVGASIGLRLITPATPVVVEVDTGHIEQVLINLVVNARDAMPVGGDLTIRLAVLPNEHDGGAATPRPMAVVTVQDTGVGMSVAVQQRIFDPFFTTKGAERGTGLGLSICYGIVQRYGGRIGVESAPLAGTTFSVWLPLAERGLEPPLESAVVSGRPLRADEVLLVEDEPMVRRASRRALERLGLRVLEAADGRQALAVLESRARPPALIVTDVIMPGLTGPELVDAARARHPAVPVLYVSGYLPEDAFIGRATPSESEFLHKPFTPDELIARVHGLLTGAPEARPPEGPAAAT